MRTFFLICVLTIVASATLPVSAGLPKNPILFVTVVPNSEDSATQCSVIASHLAGFSNAVRGGDLWIRYADGSLKNLTEAAGYGTSGMQSDQAIAVRQPCVDWTGTKALFSMVVGTPTSILDTTTYHWQIYEITGLGKDDKPVIQRISGQPYANNIAPIYGTKSNIIFVSDRPRQGSSEDYPYLDESLGMPTTSGLWSMDRSSYELQQLDHAPSGVLSPSIDSYGRVIFSRWDILQQDQLADLSNQRILAGTCSSEKSNSNANFGTRQQSDFPEPNPDLGHGSRNNGGYFSDNSNSSTSGSGDGTLFDLRMPNDFFPWTVNEDGSGAQTINHIGRHDLRDTILPSIKTDPNLAAFSSSSSKRENRSPIVNLLQLREDPTHPGTFYGVDAIPALTHASGQIVRLLNAAPSNASKEAIISYVTARSTRFPIDLRNPLTIDHTGFYRNPLPTTDGVLIASHSPTHVADVRSKTPSPSSAYAFQLRSLTLRNGYMEPEEFLTKGITESIKWVDIKSSTPRVVTFNGALWEMDPVEVVARTVAERPSPALAEQELAVFEEEHVDVASFKRFLADSNQALIISRDITQRDPDDKQQPYYLSVGKGAKQSANAKGKVYNVSDLQIFQADYLRVYQDNSGHAPRIGRRVLPVPVHDVQNRKYVENATGLAPKTSTAEVFADGSLAAFVPAKRALSWRLRDSTGAGVVHERYWLTFKAGEIRTCVRCHGENEESSFFSMNPPSNKPMALNGLLRVWKQEYSPSRVRQTAPAHNATRQVFPIDLSWLPDERAVQYEVTMSEMVGFDKKVVLHKLLDAPTTQLRVERTDVQSNAAQFVWEVRAVGKWSSSEFVSPFVFTTSDVVGVDIDNEYRISLAPEPASDLVQIQCILPDNSAATLKIYDLLGNLVYREELAAQMDVRSSVPVSAWPPGLYEVQISAATFSYRKKLIIDR